MNVPPALLDLWDHLMDLIFNGVITEDDAYETMRAAGYTHAQITAAKLATVRRPVGQE